MLAAIHLCLASFCTGQIEECTGASHLSLEQGSILHGSFQHLFPSEFWSSQGYLQPGANGNIQLFNSDPASCLYSIFTSWKWQHAPQWVQEEKKRHEDLAAKLSSMRDTWLLILHVVAYVAGLPQRQTAWAPYSLSPRMHFLSWSSQSRLTRSKTQNKSQHRVSNKSKMKLMNFTEVRAGGKKVKDNCEVFKKGYLSKGDRHGTKNRRKWLAQG